MVIFLKASLMQGVGYLQYNDDGVDTLMVLGHGITKRWKPFQSLKS